MNHDPTAFSVRLKTRKVLYGWKHKHSHSRLVRALAALLVVGAFGVGTTGCMFGGSCGSCGYTSC